MKSQTQCIVLCVCMHVFIYFFMSKIITRTRFCVRFFRFPSLQISKEIWLRKCHLYSVELLIKQSGGSDCASVRMKLPNGTYKGLITAAHIFWVKPGKYLNLADATERRHPSQALKLSVCTCFLTNCFSQAETSCCLLTPALPSAPLFPRLLPFAFSPYPFFVFSSQDFPFVGYVILASFQPERFRQNSEDCKVL